MPKIIKENDEKIIEMQPKQVIKPMMFSKQQILKSKKYQDKRDILEAILEDDKEYSFNILEKSINNFMKGKVR